EKPEGTHVLHAHRVGVPGNEDGEDVEVFVLRLLQQLVRRRGGHHAVQHVVVVHTRPQDLVLRRHHRFMPRLQFLPEIDLRGPGEITGQRNPSDDEKKKILTHERLYAWGWSTAGSSIGVCAQKMKHAPIL